MKRKIVLLLILLYCGILIPSGNQGSGTKPKGNSVKLKNEEEMKKAYEYAKNLEVWNWVLRSGLKYDEVVSRKIHEDEILKVYREKDVDVDLDTNQKSYIYHFIGEEIVSSELKYSVDRETWQTLFAACFKDEMEKLTAEGNVEFIGELKMVYSNTYFPKITVTEYKRKILKEIRRFVKNFYLKKFVKKGEYQITIKDFSDADPVTYIMIQNDKGKRGVVPITFTGDAETDDFSVGSRTNVPPQFLEDNDLGGIKYSELFSKLSVESYKIYNKGTHTSNK